jgi:hypothetical protein
VKKNVLENVVPIINELKRFLESKHSPLLKGLMECLRELLKDYKDEIGGKFFQHQKERKCLKANIVG